MLSGVINVDSRAAAAPVLEQSLVTGSPVFKPGLMMCEWGVCVCVSELALADWVKAA